MATAKSTELVEKSFIHYVPIAIVGILICAVPSAILNSCAGIYYPVMAEDFGVPVSQISLWRTFDYITGIIASPIAGIWLAKRNPKLVILIAAAVESLVFIGFGMAPELWMVWVLGAIAGVTNAVMLGVGVAAIMNMWFRSSTGLIIGICTAFTGFGGMLFSPIGQMLIDQGGWRFSYTTLGILSLIVMVIGVCVFMKSRPEDHGMLPFGAAKAAAKAAEEAGKEQVIVPSVRPSVARKSWIFWAIILFGFLINTVCNINAYFASYVVWFNSQDAVIAGAVAGAFVTGAELTAFNSFGNAAGKVGLGLFSDVNLRNAIIVLCGCGMVGLALMWQFPNSVLLPIGGVLMGAFIAAVLVIMPMTVRAAFGDGASFPIIWSNIGMSLGLGGACGSYIWGFISENFGGYSGVFGVALVCMVVLLIVGLVVYKNRDLLPREELTEEDL